MKIWYISKILFSNTAANVIQVMQMCQAMTKIGHDVTLLSASRTGNAPVPPEWSVYGVATPFQLATETLGTYKHASIYYCYKAVRHAQRAGCDLIYTRSVHAAFWSALRGVPVVLELHALQKNISEKVWLLLLSKCRARILLIFISKALKEDFTAIYRSYFAPESMMVAPDGVDVERFGVGCSSEDIRAREGIKKSDFVAGYIGSIYPGRGVSEIIIPLASRLPDVQFMIVGGTRAEHETLREEYALAGLRNVSLRTFLPNSEVPSYLGACDVLLAPYQKRISVSGGGDTSRWASPLKIFEYLASGRPMIISELPVFREVLDGNVCYFCEPDDIDAWERVLRKIMHGPQESRGIADKGVALAQRYSWTVRANRCLAHYENISKGS